MLGTETDQASFLFQGSSYNPMRYGFSRCMEKVCDRYFRWDLYGKFSFPEGLRSSSFEVNVFLALFIQLIGGN